MATRDPDKTARNRMISNITEELKILLPQVLADTGLASQQSVNATIGSKNDEFFDLKNDVILSSEEFINKWLQGLVDNTNPLIPSPYKAIYDNIKTSDAFKKYVLLFLGRSYLKHFEELSKNRPLINESEIWIGQQNANYGLLVTPRFNGASWENDKSEIRAFKQGYWTIGHVMHTGLVIPGKDSIFKFNDVDQYLLFFLDTLVRNSGSPYEYKIAELFCEFVKKSDSPLDVPLLIPEFRYLGLEKAHEYRLDFLVTNPYTLDRVGFELSPWSTHGYLKKIRGLTQKEINTMAQDNFEKEMKKHKAYFKKHNVFVLIYTDEQLSDCDKLFNDEIVPYLQPMKRYTQLSFQVMEEFM